MGISATPLALVSIEIRVTRHDSVLDRTTTNPAQNTAFVITMCPMIVPGLSVVKGKTSSELRLCDCGGSTFRL
jgi:hypothetical protein